MDFCLFLSGSKAPFNISCLEGSVVNSSTLVCLGKPLFPLQTWSGTVLERLFLAGSFHLSIFWICLSTLPWSVVSAEKSDDSRTGASFLWDCLSSPWLTSEFSLYHKLCRCFNMSWRRSFFVETTSCSISFLYSYALPLPQFWEVLSIISSNRFCSLLPLFCCWTPMALLRPFPIESAGSRRVLSLKHPRCLCHRSRFCVYLQACYALLHGLLCFHCFQ